MLVDFFTEYKESGAFYCNQHFWRNLDNCSYNIGIRAIILDLKEPLKTNNESCFMLTTNLIDRSSTNPNRTISYFILEPNKKSYIVNFSSVDKFELERTHTSSSFEIKSVFNDQEIKIKNLIVRASIEKTCLDSVNV